MYSAWGFCPPASCMAARMARAASCADRNLPMLPDRHLPDAGDDDIAHIHPCSFHRQLAAVTGIGGVIDLGAALDVIRV